MEAGRVQRRQGPLRCTHRRQLVQRRPAYLQDRRAGRGHRPGRQPHRRSPGVAPPHRSYVLRRARRARVRLAAVGSAGQGGRNLQRGGPEAYNRRRGLSRPQLGQCPDELPHQPLVLGPRPGRPLHRGRLLHHGGREVRVHRTADLPAGQGRHRRCRRRDKVSFEELGPYTDTDTGKPVANVTRYTYRDGGESYVITFTRHRDLAVSKFIDQLHGPKKVAAKLVGFDGAYLRFTGELRIERQHAGTLVESYTDSAIWELMYLGKTQKAIAPGH